MNERIVNILGKKWTIKEQPEAENENLRDVDGYCDWTTREMVIEREMNGNLGDMQRYINKVIRHEIVHAFLLESEPSKWSLNEEMVDWFARMGPRIYDAWCEAEALD